jgi:hypothetical protein
VNSRSALHERRLEQGDAERARARVERKREGEDDREHGIEDETRHGDFFPNRRLHPGPVTRKPEEERPEATESL